MTSNTNTVRAPVPAWAGILGMTLVLALGAVLFLVDPAHCPFYPQCLFRRITGWNCPGCGTLRAMHQLLHGHVLAALRDNVLFVVSLPVVAIYAVHLFSRRRAGLPVSFPVPGPRGILIFTGFLTIFTIVRNIPVAPFIYLSPP